MMSSTKQKCDSSALNTTETVKDDVMTVSVLPILCGIYSFLHWFIIVPLLWTAFSASNWHATSFLIYEIVAFAVWVVVIIVLLNLKCCKKKQTSKQPLKTYKDGSSHLAPNFQTKTTCVQPKDTTNFNNSHFSQSEYHKGASQVSISLYSIPVQPQNVSSQLSKTDVQEAVGYTDIFSQSASEIQIIELDPKANTEPKSGEASILVADNGGVNLKSSHINELNETVDLPEHNKEGDSKSLTKYEMPDSECNENNGKNSQLSREESFVGLPEMKSFGNYLQLVTVDTPFSPSEQFFPDVMKEPDTYQNILANQKKEVFVPEYNVPAIDISEKFPQRDFHIPREADPIIEVKDSLENQRSVSTSDKGCGEEEIKTGNIECDNVIKDDDEVFTPGAPIPSRKLKGSLKKESVGECFIADVHKTESLTSEIFITVNEPINSRNTDDTVCINLTSEVLQHNVTDEKSVSEEGRWALLK